MIRGQHCRMAHGLVQLDEPKLVLHEPPFMKEVRRSACAVFVESPYERGPNTNKTQQQTAPKTKKQRRFDTVTVGQVATLVFPGETVQFVKLRILRRSRALRREGTKNAPRVSESFWVGRPSLAGSLGRTRATQMMSKDCSTSQLKLRSCPCNCAKDLSLAKDQMSVKTDMHMVVQYSKQVRLPKKEPKKS